MPTILLLRYQLVQRPSSAMQSVGSTGKVRFAFGHGYESYTTARNIGSMFTIAKDGEYIHAAF